MEITGKLIQLLPEVQGESARGPWVRGGFVIETGDDYPRKVAFTAFGEDLRCSRVQPFVPGQMPAAATGNYNWNPATGTAPAQPAQAAPAAAQPAQAFAQPPAMPQNGEDDLPF